MGRHISRLSDGVTSIVGDFKGKRNATAAVVADCAAMLMWLSSTRKRFAAVF